MPALYAYVCVREEGQYCCVWGGEGWKCLLCMRMYVLGSTVLLCVCGGGSTYCSVWGVEGGRRMYFFFGCEWRGEPSPHLLRLVM